jgi:hypothetical protein
VAAMLVHTSPTQTRRSLASLATAGLSQSLRWSSTFGSTARQETKLREFLAEADAHANQACEEACDVFVSELFARV